MFLYRHLNRQWAEEFRDNGILRICPLTEYRSIPDIRQDRTEGIAITSIEAAIDFKREQSKEILGLDTNINKTGGTLNIHYDLPNGYLLSMSTKRTSDVIRRFGCDAYFTIYNPIGFKAALLRAISEVCPVLFASDGQVKYVKDKVQYLRTLEDLLRSPPSQRSIDDYFIKPKDAYADEDEYRFVFVVGPGQAEKPLFLKLTQIEVRDCCSFHFSTS